MVRYNNEIALLPQEIRERNENAGEDRRDHKGENEISKRDLKKQIKKPKLTTEQFQQHLNADPKLKSAYAEHQVLMDRQKKANERVKNTGYLGTLWGGITGDSGVDDLAKINEDMTSANTRFRSALDQNSGLSNELKQQLIGYKLGTASGVNSATSEASGDFSERAENYAAGTKAVRNTAGGAALVVGAVVAAPAIAAVAGVGGGATLGGGTATMSTVLGVSAGGGILMHAAGTGLNVVGEEGQVVRDSLKQDQTKTFAQIQNEQEIGMLDRSLERGSQFAKVGMTAPAALAVGPGVAIAGGVGRTLITGATTAAAGGAIGGAYVAGREEAKITLDAVRNPDPGKGKWDTWVDKNKKGLPEMWEKTKEGTMLGSVFGAAMTTPLGRPLATSAGMLGVAEGVTNTADNLMKSTSATGSDKIKNQNEALLSGMDTAFAGFGSKALLKASSGTKTKGPTSPESSITPRTNRAELDLGTKTRENIRRNPDRGADLSAAGTGFQKVEPILSKDRISRGKQGVGENIRKNPNKPVEGVTLPEPGTGFQKDVPPDIRTFYSRGKSGQHTDAFGNTIRETRQTRHEFDARNEINLGKMDIQSSITRDKQGNMIQRVTDAYRSGDSTSINTQTSQAARKIDENGKLIQGTNQTSFSNGSQRIVKTTPDGIDATHISASGDVKQRQWKRNGPHQAPLDGNPSKPDLGDTLLKPQSTSNVSISTNYSSMGKPRKIIDASGNTTNITRQSRSKFDRENDKNYGRTQIDSSTTHNSQGNMIKRDVSTYGPGSSANLPTQTSQASRNFDANGKLIQGENQTQFSNGSRRIVKTTPDGIDATHISASGDVKQRQREKPDNAPEPIKTPQILDHRNTNKTPESVKPAEKAPQKSPTPPENMKNMTPDTDELIKKKSLKK